MGYFESMSITERQQINQDALKQSKSLQLRQLSEDEVEWNNHISLCTSTITHQFNNPDFKFKIQPKERKTPTSQHFHRIKLSAGKHFFWIAINQWPTSFMASQKDIRLLTQSTSKTIRNMAVEVILTPVIAWLERETGLKIKVSDYSKETRALKGKQVFSFSYAENNKNLYAGQIAINKNLEKPLYSLLDRWPAQAKKEVSALCLSAQLMIGHTILTTAEVKTLELGDVIFLDQNTYSVENRMWVHFPPNTLLTLKKRAVMSNQKSQDNTTQLEVEGVSEGKAPNQNTQPTNQPAAKNLSIDTLDIKLDFDLGHISLPLSQVKRLSPGYIFSTGRPIDRAVNITSNGQRIARGELVDVEGIVGVKINRLYKQNNG